MGIKVESQREHPAALLGGDIVVVDIPSVYNNQLQNVFSIKNYGTDTLYVGVNQKISATSGYLVQIAGGGTATLPIPKGAPVISLFSASACNVLIVSFYTDEIFSNELYQTLSTVIINSTTTSSVSLSSQLPAGTNKIGSFDLASEIPAGTKKIGSVDVASLPAGDNNIGNVDVVSLPVLPAGDNNIGNVDVVSLPVLPAGDNNIGNVDIVTLPDMSTAAPTVYNLAMANANYEYSQALTNVKKLAINIQGGDASITFRIAFVAGKVAGPTAPYLTYAGNNIYFVEGINVANITVYIACSTTNKVAQIEVWS